MTNFLILVFKRLAIFAALWANTALAVQSDSFAPIEVHADKAKLSEATQTATYTGNVRLQQGTLEIMCETLIIYNTPEGVERVEAIGSPATYSQVVEETKPNLDAYAEKITYLPGYKRIRLEGQAKILQGGNVFEGQRIEYDLNDQVLVASSESVSEDGSQPQERKRVKMTLQPNSTPSKTP